MTSASPSNHSKKTSHEFTVRMQNWRVRVGGSPTLPTETEVWNKKLPTLLWCKRERHFEKHMTFLLFQFFESLVRLRSCYLELRNMSGRKESSWDALEPELYWVRPGKYPARYFGIFGNFGRYLYTFHIYPLKGQIGGRYSFLSTRKIVFPS